MRPIPYPGRDPFDLPFTAEAIDSDKSSRSRPQRAYELFQDGMDTCDIARLWMMPEAHVLRWVTIERNNELGLRSPYQGAWKPRRARSA